MAESALMLTDDPDHLLDIKKAADRLDASQDHVLREIKAGRLQAVRFGKRQWRVELRELKRYVAARRTALAARADLAETG
jgi:excisionase family DNA binding protein